MDIKELAAEKAIDLIFHEIDKDPEAAIRKVTDLVFKLDFRDGLHNQRPTIEKIAKDPGNVWHKYVLDMFDTIDRDVLKKILINFVYHANVQANPRAIAAREKYGCNIPWAILMDPTSACNLHCTGCWAAEYGNRLNLSYEELDDIICQGKELGVMMYIYTGGEPLVRKDDIIRLCEKHSDAMFLAFTNATLIDDKFADDMLRVKNFIPAISVEGFEESTDDRRGQGTYQRVVEAMKRLRDRKLPFGISCCYTSRNCDVIGSEAYYDQMIGWGAKFCWFFTYMPVGVDAVPELMATAEQRSWMYDQVRAFRKTKPIFTIDFWNDGEFVGGCIAGGRRYLHINAAGDIEPCTFIHYSDSNIREKSLIEAFRSPLFMAYRNNQPFNDNLLRPCPLLDNPQMLQKMVHESGAHSTDYTAPEDVDAQCATCFETAAKWAPVADEIWKRDFLAKHPGYVPYKYGIK
ncbi:MAG: radical SAM protein [Firmicutes bacterium]|nr:radical SAM protein [Bacillota bacterium]